MKIKVNNVFYWFKRSLAWVLISVTLSCNYTKHLTENQTLVKSNVVKLKTDKPIKYRGEFESSLLSLITPQANTHMFDLDFFPKYKLWRYNNRYDYFIKHDTDKKIVKHKVERPTLVDTSLITKTERTLKQYLINQGYFYAKIKSEIIPEGYKQARVVYHIETGKSYYINEVKYNIENPILNSYLLGDKQSLIKPKEIFTNYLCGLERERIYRLMQQNGFYDFKSDNVSFKIDTTDKSALLNLLEDPFEQSAIFKKDTVASRDSIDVKILVEKTKDNSYAIPYYIDSVIVYINDHQVNQDRIPITFNCLDSIYFSYKNLPINRKVIARNIFVKPNELYNPKSKELTINRLNQLNVFQFINIRYDKIKEQPGKLVCRITLDMLPKREYSIFSDANTTDADYIFGAGGSVQYKDKNLFHGANQLSLKGSASVQFRNDSLLTGTEEFYLSGNNVNVNASLTFPKFIVPFFQKKISKKNVPFTLVGLNYNYILRKNNYTIKNLSGNFGYTWKETDQKNWRFNPVFVTLTFVPEHLLNQSFIEKKKSSPYLNSIFSSNIISGENVTFEYKSKERNLYKDIRTLKIGFEEAGTLLKGINGIYRSITQSEIQPISHYLRLDVDVRSYKNYRKGQWANRVFLGIGAPLYSSNSLPYIKQYSAGGSFSLRGFRARALGPGRSQDSSYAGGNLVIDKTGDIKFETNTEYRFNLLKLFSGAINLKGATFMDVGNIWLFKEDPAIEGGEFDTRYLFQDLAMSAGVGLRLDFSFFVVRVDMAYPLKQPSVLNNYGFMFDQLNYVKDMNIVLGFGYPF